MENLPSSARGGFCGQQLPFSAFRRSRGQAAYLAYKEKVHKVRKRILYKILTILTDGDHEGGECVTTDDTAVIHDVLRRYLTVKSMKEVRLRLLVKICVTDYHNLFDNFSLVNSHLHIFAVRIACVSDRASIGTRPVD